MKRLLYLLNYVHTPRVREKSDYHLMFESIRKKVWNPVFTTGTITFVTSMLFRGFFNEAIAVFPLGISTLILFSGVWILSSVGMVVFDKNESKSYFVYTHLGYLRKIYSYPITSFDKVMLADMGHSKYLLQILKDDGEMVKVAASKNKAQLMASGNEIADFLKIPLEV